MPAGRRARTQRQTRLVRGRGRRSGQDGRASRARRRPGVQRPWGGVEEGRKRGPGGALRDNGGWRRWQRYRRMLNVAERAVLGNVGGALLRRVDGIADGVHRDPLAALGGTQFDPHHRAGLSERVCQRRCQRGERHRQNGNGGQQTLSGAAKATRDEHEQIVRVGVCGTLRWISILLKRPFNRAYRLKMAKVDF